MQTNLPRLAEVFGGIRDPRSKQGTNLPLSGLLTLTFLGLLAGQNYLAHIQYGCIKFWRGLLRFPLVGQPLFTNLFTSRVVSTRL